MTEIQSSAAIQPNALTIPVDRRFGFIDGLRGIAILAVVGLHSSQAAGGELPEAIKKIANTGALGVQLFFVVSAFTLFLSLSNPRPERRPVLSFYIRRLFRILPMYWLILLLGILPALLSGHLPRKMEVLATATFTNGFIPHWINEIVPGGWSVTAEMTFYLFVPYAFKKIKTVRQAMWVTIIATLASTLLIGWMRSDSFSHLVRPLVGNRALNPDHMINKAPVWSYWFLSFWFPTQVPVFCMGILAYKVAAKFHAVVRTDAVALCLLAVACLVFATVIFIPRGWLQREDVAGFSFLCLILSAALRPWRFLTHPMMEFIGKVSFSVYLTHFRMRDIVLDVLSHHAALNPVARFGVIYLATLILAIAASAGTFYLIELPGISLGKRLVRWVNQPIR